MAQAARIRTRVIFCWIKHKPDALRQAFYFKKIEKVLDKLEVICYNKGTTSENTTKEQKNMAKLYKESARMEDAINSIVKILHDEYEVPAGAGLRIAMNTLYAIVNKMDTVPGYYLPLVQNDLWLAFNDVVTDGDINKFSHMLWDARNATAQS